MPKSSSGPPGLWLADRMMPPSVLRWRIRFDARLQWEGWTSVEFYKGAVFHSLGLPTHYFTALFAMARVYGYIALTSPAVGIGKKIRDYH